MLQMVKKINIYKTIIEEDSYHKAINAIGNIENIDIATEVVFEALSKRPEGFDYIKGYEPLRLAKTDKIIRNDGQTFPALRIWFRINLDDTISLLYVEKIPDDEE